MKRISYILTLIAVVILSSCEPQMDKAPELGSKPTGDFSIDNTDPNHIKLEATYENAFIVAWDLGNGMKAQGATVDAYYPFSGTYTIQCILDGKAGQTLIEKQLTVTKTDPELAQKPGIKELTNEGVGRTWVFYHDNPDMDGAYFYMTANYDWDEFWWDPVADDCCSTPEISEDSIRFDLDGAFNYTVYHNGEATKGTFIYNDEDKTLQLADANLPYFEINQEEELLNPDAFATGLFKVHTLQDDQLWLWQDQTSDDYDYGWMWVFIPSNSSGSD